MTHERRRLSVLLAALAAVLLGLVLMVPIYENDLFLQIRAGEEIVHGHGVQTVDEWSSTAAGTPWHNVEWLATVLFYGWSRLAPGYRLMPALRALLSALLLFLPWRLAGRRRPDASGPDASAGLETFVVLPLVFAVCRSCTQLRPDLPAILVYATLLLRLTSPGTADRRKAAEAVGLVALWANLNGGTAVIGVALVWAWLLLAARDLRPGARALGAVLALGAWFATPAGLYPVSVLWQHTFGYDRAVLSNDDQMRFSPWLFDVRRFGLRFWWWLALTAAAGVRLVRGEAGPYRSRFFVLVVGLGLTAMTLMRLRAIGYQTLFLLPLAADAVRQALEAARSRWGEIHARNGALLALAALWAVPIHELVHKPALLEFGVFEQLYPVHSVEFLERERPKGRLYNSYDQGGYLVDTLREYPVSIDSREMVFRELMAEQNQLYAKPSREAFAAFLKGHGFNILLLPPPEIHEVPGRGFLDVYHWQAPPEEWALVFADSASLVYLRRIPEHARILDRQEFHILYHGIPPEYPARTPGLDPAFVRTFESEARLCLALVPSNDYCRQAVAAFGR